MYIQHRRRYLSAAITGRSFYMVPSLYSSFWCVGYIPRGLDAYGQQTCVHTHLTYVQEEKGNKRPDYPVGGSNPLQSLLFFLWSSFFRDLSAHTFKKHLDPPPPQHQKEKKNLVRSHPSKSLEKQKNIKVFTRMLTAAIRLYIYIDSVYIFILPPW